jgi:hypothetical protein
MKRVVIYVSGGLVQSVFGDEDVKVEVFDDDIFDSQDVDDDGRTQEEFEQALLKAQSQEGMISLY